MYNISNYVQFSAVHYHGIMHNKGLHSCERLECAETIDLGVIDIATVSKRWSERLANAVLTTK